MRAQVDKSRLSSDSGGRRTSDESRIVQRLKRLSPQMVILVETSGVKHLTLKSLRI
jgi:hypothetical protein